MEVIAFAIGTAMNSTHLLIYGGMNHSNIDHTLDKTHLVDFQGMTTVLIAERTAFVSPGGNGRQEKNLQTQLYQFVYSCFLT